MLFSNSSPSFNPADDIYKRNEEEDTSDQAGAGGPNCLGVLSERYTGGDPRDQTYKEENVRSEQICFVKGFLTHIF